MQFHDAYLEIYSKYLDVEEKREDGRNTSGEFKNTSVQSKLVMWLVIIKLGILVKQHKTKLLIKEALIMITLYRAKIITIYDKKLYLTKSPTASRLSLPSATDLNKYINETNSDLPRGTCIIIHTLRLTITYMTTHKNTQI